MEKKKVVDKGLVHFDEFTGKKTIPFLGGRPDRDTVINDDDIANLKINLNVTKSVDEFIELM